MTFVTDYCDICGRYGREGHQLGCARRKHDEDKLAEFLASQFRQPIEQEGDGLANARPEGSTLGITDPGVTFSTPDQNAETDLLRVGAVLLEKPPILPIDSASRKDMPVYSGVMAYFPRALAYVAKISKAGNDKHNPGQPLHWSRDKSSDHLDCIARHLIDTGTTDPEDGLLHDGKMAWRALANLELKLEQLEKEAK